MENLNLIDRQSVSTKFSLQRLMTKLWGNPGPDTGWSCMVCLSFFVYNFIYYGMVRSSGVIYNELLTSLHFSSQESAWPFSIQCSACFCAGLLSGHFVIYFSIRWVTFFAFLASTVSYAALYFGPVTFVWLIVWYGIVNGFALGVSTPAMYTVVVSYFKNLRTTALLISLSGSALGGCLLPPALTYLIEEYGLQGSFLLTSCLCAQGLVFSLFLRSRDETQFHPKYFPNKDYEIIPDEDNNIKVEEQKTVQPGVNNKILRSVFPDILMKLLNDRVYWMLSVSSIFIQVANVTYQSLFVSHVISRGFMSGPTMLSVANTSDLLSRFVFCYVSDKKIISTENFYTGLLTIYGSSLIVTGFCQNEYTLYVCAALAGIGFSGYLPLRSVLIANLFGVDSTTFAIGVQSFITGLLALMIPSIIGGTTEIGQGFDNVFYLVGSSVLFGVGVWCLEKLSNRTSKDNDGVVNIRETEFYKSIT